MTVLDSFERWFEQQILQTLQGEGDALTRLRKMCAHVSDIYEGGQQPCVSAILLMSSARNVFHDTVKARLQAWIDAIADVLVEAGLNKRDAKERAEDALIAIQGALILVHGLDDLAPFQRVVKRLPQELCRDF